MPQTCPGGSSTCDQLIDPAKSSGPRSTSHGHMRSVRGCCGLQALAIGPGLSDRLRNSIILIASAKFSTRAGKARRLGGKFCGGARPGLVSIPGKVLRRRTASSEQMPRHLVRTRHAWSLVRGVRVSGKRTIAQSGRLAKSRGYVDACHIRKAAAAAVFASVSVRQSSAGSPLICPPSH